MSSRRSSNQQDQNDQQGEDENQQDSESEQEGDQQVFNRPKTQQSGEPNPDEMTREDAERLLNALNNKEEDLLKDFHKNQVPQNQRHAKELVGLTLFCLR